MRSRRLIEIEDPDAERQEKEAKVEAKRRLVERLKAGRALALTKRAEEAAARVRRRTALIEKRAQQARTLLGRWERRVAAAQRKVKKLRRRVRYYERRNS